MMAVFLETVRIGEGHSESGFSCDEPALDRFFAIHALANDWRGLGRTFVLEGTLSEFAGVRGVLGFYTLSMAGLDATRLPTAHRVGLPRYPVPVALIGRLAVERRAQGRGVGQRLLVDAMARIASAAQQVACLGVVVDAKNAPAVRFYERFGFEVLDTGERFPVRMFLPVATAAAAM